jgi:soluble lytic murein transglycosylase-like protein
VPTPDELPAYRDTVARLLWLAAERSFDPEEAGERYDGLFHHLVKAVAWQESCWRQFVRKDGAVTYLLSPSGDVGMMQVNVRIWRGFFRPDRLRWSATYNAGAGTEILYELLLRYGRREAKLRLEDGARATYSAYNGGPARYRRYRTTRVPADLAFWRKYRAVVAGDSEDEGLCVPLRRARS